MSSEQRHLTDEQLVDYHYASGAEREALAAEMGAHLRACDACRANLAALERTLAALSGTTVPERGEDYGRNVWERLLPQLGQPAGAQREAGRRSFALFGWGGWFAPRRLAFAASAAALVVAAFLVGRYTRPRGVSPGNGGAEIAAGSMAQGRDRILLVAVGDHLERSQMVLVELVNANPRGGPLNISAEQQRAEDLVAANRLYRQTAMRVGETGIASVLDELGRVLAEIANSPAQISSPQLAELRKRIESRGIIFKIRVVSTDVRARQKAIAPRAALRKTS